MPTCSSRWISCEVGIIKLLILHIAFVFGGAERTTSNLLSYLDRRRIRHITLVAPEALRRELPQAYDRFIDASCYGPLRNGFDGTRALRADAAKIGRILRETVPDVALGMMHYSSALIVLGARLARVPTRTVASFRGPIFEYMKHYEPNWRRRFFLRNVVTATSLLADRVIVPSQGTKNELKRRFLGRERKTLVVPNGIDWEAAARSAQEPIPAAEHLLSARPLLCTAARLAAEKNLHLLLTAFRLVRQTHSASLVIVGDGPERPALEATVAAWGLGDAVFFVGHQANVYPYLHRADLFIHTCQFEGFGYAMLEAMACGTAVIATDCPYGPREVLGDNRYGVLVPPDDAECLAAAIRRLLEDDSARRELAARGVERARALSVSRMAQRYEEALCALAARGRRTPISATGNRW